jgi:hypothetical protein
VIERLWDDPVFEKRHRRLASEEAKRWDGRLLVEQYDSLFRGVAASH